MRRRRPASRRPRARRRTCRSRPRASQFLETSFTAPADQPFTIGFLNNDPNTPHNVEIKDASGGAAFLGDVFPGVELRVYDVPALAAGSYTFICTVHPDMTGTATLE